MKLQRFATRACTGLALAVTSAWALASQTAAPEMKPSDKDGNIHVPERYRTGYEYMGTWSIAGKTPGAEQLHFVFASPGATAAFEKDGKFPDGTVLVKEVYDATTAAMTTGPAVGHASNLKGWFVMIKDSKNAHAANPLWGDGWGWSWFDAGKPMKTTSTNYHSDCLGCHIPAKDTDWVYTQGYPTLQKSTSK
jgi:cytochrome P460